DSTAIPWQVWLLENPSSPIAFPGSIDLYGHDCLHLLLNRGIFSFDEAFVVGFTMGNCTGVTIGHLPVFKILSRYFYPHKYRFNLQHFVVFNLGFEYGKKIEFKNLNSIDFSVYFDCKISDLRNKFGIVLDDIMLLWNAEKVLLRNSMN
ncbi:MAG: hypothetical protein WCD18_00830, partial [Thermosynechococcaceae cyanobacterium]